MQGNRGVAKILIIISSVLLLTSIVVLFLIFNKDESINNTEQISLIEKSLKIDERAEGLVPEKIIVESIIGNFARGTVIDSRDGIERNFYSININGVWRIVEITSSPVSCERFARLGFPGSMISDCKLYFNDAVSIAEIDATLDALFLESAELKVIGLIENIENTTGGQIVTISADGESIKINISNNVNIQEGDLIVTNITAPQNYITAPQNTSDVIFASSETVIVNEEDRELENSQSENIVNNQNNIPVNQNTNSILKINAPKTYAPPSYFFNAYDIDNSFIDVELDGSF